jgi:beta-glucanase (GH16 family)
MIRRISAALVVAIAAIGVTGTAVAASGHAARTYKASLTAVNPAATTAGVAGVVGRAQLVDGRNNKVSLHVRNLAANTMYLWHVHEGSCVATGAPVAGWTYRTQDAAGDGTVMTDAAGNGNTKGKSATFNADPTKSYSVNVHVASTTNGLPAGTIIACGDLKANKGNGKANPKHAGGKNTHKPAHPPQAQGPKH